MNECEKYRSGGINFAKGYKSKNKSKNEEEFMRMVEKSKETFREIVKFKRENENWVNTTGKIHRQAELFWIHLFPKLIST